MYRPAGPTWKISKRTQAEIREIHRTLPVMLLFLFGRKRCRWTRTRRHLSSDLGERTMRMSSSLVAPSAVAILSTALLCGLTGTAMSQTTPSSSTSLPGVTVEAPKQVARPPQAGAVGKHGCRSPESAGRRTPAQTATRTPPPAPGSVLAKLKELERTSSNCTDGCQSSFKYGNQPWNGCSVSGADIFSATCRNVRNFKTYAECTEHGLFLAGTAMASGGIAAACSPEESWPGRSFRSPNSSDQRIDNSHTFDSAKSMRPSGTLAIVIARLASWSAVAPMKSGGICSALALNKQNDRASNHS